MDYMSNFIKDVLGDTAAQALHKATEHSQALGSVLGPRVVLGWLSFAGNYGYDGEVPGVSDSTLTFKKSEDGLFNGSLSIGSDGLDFSNASPTQLAATLTVALGGSHPLSKGIKDSDLVGLGKSVDLLVKSRVVQLLKAAINEGAKSGTQATPRGPLEPIAPEGEKKANANQQPKLPSQTKIKLTKSQAEKKCSVCEAASFDKKGNFCACACFCLRALAKSASSVATDDGFEVTFGKEWSQNNIRVFLDIVGGPYGK